MAQRSVPCGSDMTPIQIKFWACTKADTDESREEKSERLAVMYDCG
jgi:hypothetical protein